MRVPACSIKRYPHRRVSYNNVSYTSSEAALGAYAPYFRDGALVAADVECGLSVRGWGLAESSV